MQSLKNQVAELSEKVENYRVSGFRFDKISNEFNWDSNFSEYFK